MIKELWQYVASSTELPVAKQMGFLKEAIAMGARSKRCQRQWDAHYLRCKQTIFAATQRAVQKRTVLIFGAGSLNDIPLSYLSSQFFKVVLVDLVFLKPARRMASNYSNIELIEHDVTESLEWLCQGQTLVQSPFMWLDDSSIDLVISLNLITQLPLIPVRWLMNEFDLSESEADIVGKQLIFAHLRYLKQFSGEVCLIADRVDIELDSQGVELDRFDPWWDVEQPKADIHWEWEVMPLGESSASKSQKNVIGVSTL
ncbi:hypothetical protein [Thiomicrorhabdus arctica]|uniref:hypothetical protein n=1 Tax=Thiomicrorhabdus arctica TaxID=131540 RepID=UPI00037FB65E|nr:hypothetical protein [Thiomicrorhabdus arctica]